MGRPKGSSRSHERWEGSGEVGRPVGSGKGEASGV